MSGKGGKFERDIARFLTKWLTGKEKPYMYWRQDASGAIATIHIENYHMAGDIKAIHPDADFLTRIFTIELKTGYPKTSFWQFFSKAEFKIKEFWEETISETPESKHPMLIYRKLGRRPIVGISEGIFEKLLDKLYSLRYIYLSWENNKVYLFDKDDFFEVITPEILKGLKWQD